METKKKEKYTYKQIKDKKVEYEVFVTKDGKEFTNKKDAEGHEAQLLYLSEFKNIRKVSLWIDSLSIEIDFYKVEKEEHIPILKRHFDADRYTDGVDKIIVGNWVGGCYRTTYNSCGDSDEDVTIISLDDVLKEMQDALTTLKQGTQ